MDEAGKRTKATAAHSPFSYWAAVRRPTATVHSARFAKAIACTDAGTEGDDNETRGRDTHNRVGERGRERSLSQQEFAGMMSVGLHTRHRV